MKKHLGYLAALFLALTLYTTSALAHCEIPCGIYDDKMRITMIAEHITTIEKSMNMILDIEKDGSKNSNQLVRWVTNKENHANELQEIVTQYFMTQRIKVDTDKYAEKLQLLHQLLIGAMKAKQTVDLGHVATLRTTLEAFDKLYFAPHS